MQTRSSSRLVNSPSSNPTSSTNLNPKGCNRRRSKQMIENFNLDELSPPVVTMADQRTMAQLLQAPTEGYEDAIVVLAITADNFELKHGLLTLVQNKQFFGHDKEDPHAHGRYFNKITSTFTFPNVLNTSIKLMLFPFSPEDIIESKSKVRYTCNKPVVSKVSTNTSTSGISLDVAELKDMVKALLLDKKSQNQSPAPVKAVEESYVTCGGAHSYRNCPAADGNVYRDNIQEFVSQAFAFNYNQGNTSYRPPMMSNQIRPPSFHLVPNNQNVQRNNQNRFIPNQNRRNNFNQGPVYQPLVFQPLAYQAPTYQAPAPQAQGVSKEDFSAYVKANDAVMRNMQTQGQNMQNQLTNLTDLITKFVNSNNASTLTSATSGETPEVEAFVLTLATTAYQVPAYQALAPQTRSVSKEDFSAYVKANDAVMRNMQTQGQNMQNQLTNLTDLITKFVNSNSDSTLSSGILPSNTITNPKSDLKAITTRSALIGNKEKLSEMARTPLNEHYSAVLLKKLPEKLGDPGKFLIPCDFPGMAECLALEDLGAGINLMPFSVWKTLSLPDLTPTCMTLELADRLISRPVGVAKYVYVKVGSFHFSADYVVVDFDADPRVPLILRRSFLKTGRALIDVFEGELTLRVGKEAITFNLDQTSRYSANYSDMTAKRIDVIDMACEEYSQEVLGFSDTILSGNPTPFYDPIVSTTSSTLTMFKNSDFLLEEVDSFLAIEDEPTSSKFYQPYLDPEGFR
nr:reverse transcriptase domain-containing protein [Tanacetum cinerariifolium]